MPINHSRIAGRVFNCCLLATPNAAESVAYVLLDNPGRSEPLAPRAGSARGLDGDDRGADAPYTINDGVATIAIRGELVNRGSWLDAASGLVSYDALGAALRQARDDRQVRGVLLDIDSPGGEAAGAVETAELVRAVSATKRVVAYANPLAASAAYIIGAGADRMVVTPSSTVGSIGVVWLHLDYSAQLAARGVKPTLIHAGAFKVDGNSLTALDPKARERIKAAIDEVYNLITASVGKHRPALGAAGARATEAGLYMGRKAVDAGLADIVGTLETATRLIANPAAFQSTSTSARTQSEFHTMKSYVSAPIAAAPAQLSQAEQTNALWSDAVAKINARAGVQPPPAAVPIAAYAANPLDPAQSSAARQQAAREAANEMVRRQTGGRGADDLWAEAAAKLNATLPANARISAGGGRA